MLAFSSPLQKLPPIGEAPLPPIRAGVKTNTETSHHITVGAAQHSDMTTAEENGDTKQKRNHSKNSQLVYPTQQHTTTADKKVVSSSNGGYKVDEEGEFARHCMHVNHIPTMQFWPELFCWMLIWYHLLNTLANSSSKLHCGNVVYAINWRAQYPTKLCFIIQ